AADDFGGGAFVRGVRRRPSVIGALSAGSGLPAPRAGALPARVRDAEAAGARNHLLHAHLEGSHAAILAGRFRDMAAPTAVAMSILCMTASSRNPGPSTNPATLTFLPSVDGSEAAIERTAQFGFVLPKSAALLQLGVVYVDSCNHAALLCAVAQI